MAKVEIAKLRDWGRRGWDKIRVLSSHDNTFNNDLLVEEEQGKQKPGISVFSRTADDLWNRFVPADLVALCAGGVMGEVAGAGLC